MSQTKLLASEPSDSVDGRRTTDDRHWMMAIAHLELMAQVTQ